LSDLLGILEVGCKIDVDLHLVGLHLEWYQDIKDVFVWVYARSDAEIELVVVGLHFPNL
jgi:hypothetical protein